MSTKIPAYVIEVGDVTAGIVVATAEGFQFYAADRKFKSLDQALFQSVEDADRAARKKAAGKKLARRGH